MAETRTEIAGVLAPPPLLFFSCLIVGCLTHWMLPFPILPDTGKCGTAVASALFAGALIIALWAMTSMQRNRTPISPSRPTERIVAAGPFRFTRNPLYLSLVLVFAGTTVLLNSWWMCGCLVGLFCLLHFGVILREEKYLAAKFGQEYLDYQRRVRRWI